MTPWSRAAWTATLVLFAVLVPARRRLDDALWILDFVNLAFHEGGHIIFGLLGSRFIMVAGGTLMQLIMPMAALFHDEGIGRGVEIAGCLIMALGIVGAALEFERLRKSRPPAAF